MNGRERLWAGIVGALAACLVAWYAVAAVLGSIDSKRERIEKLTAEVNKKNIDVQKARLATKRLAEYEARSLPPDVDLATSHYHAWLIKLSEQSGLEPTVSTKKPQSAKNAYRRIGFTVSAAGELPQLVDFLHRFQEMDWLHRIEKLNVTPLNDSKKILIGLDISALALNSAPKSEQLAVRVSEKWKATTLADYRDPILNRNFFGAPNNEPKLDLPSKTSTHLGRTFELPVKASDPDPLDRVTYVISKNADPPAKIDEKSGKLTWSPRAKGDFTFEIVARDDGLPSRSASKTIQVSVTDPPPPKKEEPRKLAFDDAKYTFLTAVILVSNGSGDGQQEIWLHNRPKGEIRRLRVGDRFEIGSVKGEVSEIGVDQATLLIDGKSHRLAKGDSLASSVATVD